MEKDFDGWNEKKKALDKSEREVNFHEREIWWCSIGFNVGSEQHSESEDFGRPVLVVRRFTQSMFWGVPLTTKLYKNPFRHRFALNGIENDILLIQMRAWDSKRLIRKVGTMPKNRFEEFKLKIRRCL